MIRFKVKEMMIQKGYERGRRIAIKEVAESTGIHRMTLSKMINVEGYSTTTEHLDRLCKFFGCKLEDIAEFLPEADETRNPDFDADAARK